MIKLTEQQEKAFEFIRQYGLTSGNAPTLRELCDYMGYRAVGSAQDVVAALRRKGYICPVDRRFARNLLLTEKGKKYKAKSQAQTALVPEVTSYTIPCLGSVPAGNPLEVVEEKVGYITVAASLFQTPRPSPARLFALRAQGLSMVGAGIIDGDWLIVSPQQEGDDGNIIVARVEDEVTVKRLRRDGNGWLLQPENPDFTPIYAKDRPFQIVGKVVALQRVIS
jgi:repressor LexA